MGRNSVRVRPRDRVWDSLRGKVRVGVRASVRGRGVLGLNIYYSTCRLKVCSGGIFGKFTRDTSSTK